MKSLEELYKEVMGSDELKAAFVAAVKENKVAEFLKAQGCEATEAETAEFLKTRQSAEGELDESELDMVSGGGCSADKAVTSVMLGFIGCKLVDLADE